eukprot:gene25214-30456_t
MSKKRDVLSLYSSAAGKEDGGVGISKRPKRLATVQVKSLTRDGTLPSQQGVIISDKENFPNMAFNGVESFFLFESSDHSSIVPSDVLDALYSGQESLQEIKELGVEVESLRRKTGKLDELQASVEDLQERLRSNEQRTEELRRSNEQQTEELRRSNEQQIEELRRSNEQQTEELRRSNEQQTEELRRSSQRQMEELHKRLETSENAHRLFKEKMKNLLTTVASLID